MIFRVRGIVESLVEPENKEGTIEEEDTVVIYYYRKKPANVIVHHYEEGTTTKVSEDDTVGNILIAGPKRFSGIKNAIQADGDDGIYILGNKIGMDALTNLTHKVNVLVVEDEELGG